MSAKIIDSHAHLDWESFTEDRDAVIERAFEQGVVQMVQAGVYLHNIEELIALCDRYQYIYCGVGLHPHEAKTWNADSESIIRNACKHQKVVAIGECGLDFHYNHSDREDQLKVFIHQVILARELDKPLIIHTRNAWEDTFQILKEHGRGEVRGVFHCFTGGPDVVPAIKELDFYVSFSGIVTFPKAKDIQAAAPLISPERILVETDCPYLSPQGMRGKRNEPANVWLVAKAVASLRGIDTESLAEITAANTRRLFGLPTPLE